MCVDTSIRLHRSLSLWTRVLIATALLMLGAPAHAAEKITYYHLDALGSPVAATDELGNVVWKETYAPYGSQIQKPPAAAGNDRWYTGKPYDSEVGLSYFGARWYDPSIGRFMGVDPQVYQEEELHSFNRYGYANNNPYKFVDPDGKAVWLIVLVPLGWMGGGAVVSGGTDAAIQQATTGTVQWGGIGGVLDAAGDGVLLGPAFGAAGTVRARMVGEAVKNAEAAAARDALAGSLAPLKGQAPATVTGGYNVRTGEVAARACGGGKCAEDHVVGALGGKKADVRFTTAKRPRTGEEVPVCPRCELSYGRDSFPPGTKFKSDTK